MNFKALDYSSVKPSGFPSKIRKAIFYPSTQYTDIKANDIVRFNINAPGFWDPYSAVINITVDTSKMDPEGSFQLDGSAHSFINESIISVGLTEVERIQEYDVLASILNDMSFSQEARALQRHQGMNSEVFPNSSIQEATARQIKPGLKQASKMTIGGVADTVYVFERKMETRLLGYQPTVKFNAEDSLIDDALTFDDLTGNRMNRGYDTSAVGICLNPADVAISDVPRTKSDVDSYLTRADYGLYYDRDINFLEKYTGTRASGYTTVVNNPGELGVQDAQQHTREEWAYQGMRKPFRGSFSCGTFEDQFSRGVSNRIMYRGNPSEPTQRSATIGRYTVPLLSGFIGALIPKDKYKLIPAFTFQPLQIEFRINPFAFFTSGYIVNSGSGNVRESHSMFKNLTEGRQMDRTLWRITEISIEVDLLQFDTTTTDAVKAQIEGSGIVFSTTSYTLGPLWSLQNTLACTGTFQVNLGLESLKALLVCYLSNDYLNYSFCRKLYKLSSNVTWLQAKFGIDYVPDKPIEGHGGNPDMVLPTDKNNETFIRELYRCFNISNFYSPTSIVNKYNFAINQRIFDVTNTRPYLGEKVTWGGKGEVNVDTAQGWPLVHENRCVGRAVYCIDLTNSALKSNNILDGINTIDYRPFDLAVKTDGIGLTPLYDRPRTMYVFCHYDFVVQLFKNQVKVIGR